MSLIIGLDGIFADPLSVSLSASQNNYSPAGLADTLILYLNNTSGASIDITGIDASGGGAAMRGRWLWVIAAPGSADIRFVHNSGSSTAENRFDLGENTNYSIGAVGWAIGLIHNGVLWLHR